ncbi:MAG: alpha/beta hydrolase [Gammaproteobacteria bacterium]|jgi:pimeloyl-ACP methyl ester carboxylesterase
MITKNYRTYGKAPFNVVVVHGGPGATGGVMPVAKELAKHSGVIEPLQTAKSVSGQVQELKDVLDQNADLPVVLIGHSWGAWLSFLLAVYYPNYVKKLILIGSAPFENKYAEAVMKNRMDHLNDEEKAQLNSVFKIFNDPESQNKDVSKFKRYVAEIDSYDPHFYEEDDQEFCLEIFRKVWSEAAKLRESGELLKLTEKISWPVVAIHGDYDPHPYEGVKLPLAAVLKDFKFFLLEKCGHTPWIERAARDKFYQILRDEIGLF